LNTVAMQGNTMTNGPRPQGHARAPQERLPVWRWLAGGLGLATWLAWSLLVARAPELGFRYTPNQIAWLAALPALVMACLRVLDMVVPGTIAGSGWSTWATAGLLPLAAAMGTVAERPATPYAVLVGLALACGAGTALFAAAIAPHSAPLADQAPLVRRPASLSAGWLAAGGFGSVIGLVPALPLLAASMCPDALPLAGALPLLTVAVHAAGTKAGDRLGHAQVAAAAFAALLPGTGVLLGLAERAVSAPVFLAAAAAWAAAAGIACAAAFARVRGVFAGRHARAEAALAFAAMVGAFGGFVLPKALGTAWALGGTVAAPLALFLTFYLSCVAVALAGPRASPPLAEFETTRPKP
jgi:nitrate/nitrite transporter NarK